ncbi:O-antigen translocase [Rhizobium sp. ARZ01]|uniref:O-antigen translocase n=1 Tax=Rhizobium sp. ARZ01 TaxID=2769313 RepID=UPI00177CB8DB|nr:O-antigen translocase [Rhizobium sp. ARZ01]MBD9374388.1 O-antigen translocase [Rhizobium sp. ARZ01]
MATQDTSVAAQSYFQILKAMILIGGSSLVNVLCSIVRNKAMAVLLGPAGVGQMGLYSSIIDLTQVVAGLGVQSSGVRQIATAAGTGNIDWMARTATALRRTSIVLGIIGALLLAALAQPIANLTFGDDQYTAGVALLSFAIFFQLVAGGQLALIQGMRNIASLARISILSGLCSTVITVALVYIFGTNGIAPSIVASAAAMFLIARWFGRNVQVNRTVMSARQLAEEISPLLKLGLVFMVSGLLMAGSSYVIRLIVLHDNGVIGAGLYQSAWALGGIYAGFILQAMGTDFFPRLAAVASDHEACNRLVNDQTHISLLLAGPGVIATLTLAPVAMWLFYSPEFYPAAAILRWICLGMMLRIIAWPLGYIIIAKGSRGIFFWTEAAATGVHVGLAWFLVAEFGPLGAGIAFFGLYVWHGWLIYAVARRLTGFRWSKANLRLGASFIASTGAIFCATLLLPSWQSMVIGTLATIVSGVYSLLHLIDILPEGALPRPIRTWISKSA